MIDHSKHDSSRRSFLILAGGALTAFSFPAGISLAATEDPTRLFNEIRKAHGLPDMATDTKLEAAALFQARLMASHQKISHSVGWGNSFGARIKKAGIRGPAAENLAAGQTSTKAAFDAWMKSPGHRRNMLDPIFSRYGLAWATPENKPHYIYWAMIFGT